MVRLAATSPLALVLATTAALSAGCFDTSSSSTTLDYPTLLTVDPVHFRGGLSCGSPGLARYVVSLFDVSEPSMNCASPPCATTTSIPVPCQHQVSFGEPPLQHAHYYIGIIDGYSRDDVRQREPGSRDMLDPASDEIIAPTWTTTCGELPPDPPPAEDAGLEDAEANRTTDAAYNPLRFPTRVLDTAEVILHGCLPLAEASKPDASTDDGSVPPEDASVDAQPPEDAGLEAGEAAAPDSSGPEPEDASGEGGGEDGPAADGASGDTEADEGAIVEAGRAKRGRP
jgi:hypothetical protein